MANFNYLDFFKTPSTTDTKLFIKDIDNNIVWSLSPFKIKSSIIQNNNIRINFTNGDYILIDFNNVYESKYALQTLQSAITTLRDKTPNEIDKDVILYIDNLISGLTFSSGSASTGDITFTGATISTINNNQNISFKTRETGEFIITDGTYSNFKIEGSNSWISRQGDTTIYNNLVMRGAMYLNPYIQDRNLEYGWTLLTTGTYSVIDTFNSDFRTVKYLLSCDKQSTPRYALSCEILLTSPYDLTDNPIVSVYAITSTTASQFVLFDCRRKSGDNTQTELIAYTNQSNCYITLYKQYIIYPND